MQGPVGTSASPPSALAVPPATANTWSTGAPAASPAATQQTSTRLHGSGAASACSFEAPCTAVEASGVPSPTPALNASNSACLPLASEATSHVAPGGPACDLSTQVPSCMIASSERLSKQSSSYLVTPSLAMAAWRSGVNTNHGDDTNLNRADNPSQVFDPTEVPSLRHTMKISVIRDGKTVEEMVDPYEVARLYGQQQAALRSLKKQYDFLAVPDWVRVHPLLGSYLAELVGSFSWVLTLALVSVRNQSIFTVADDTNMTPIPIGFMFTSMIFTFGYISSAHLNPAVSVAVFLVRQMDLSQCFLYILCQLGGAFLAGVMSMVIQGNTDVFVPAVSSSYITSGIFSELIFTFAICLVVLNIAYSRQSGNFFYGFAVGMTISAGSASVGRISGGAFNPAAATGLQVAMCVVSNCDQLKSVWVYWLAPLIGAVAAALLFSQMVQPNDTQVLEDVKVFQDVRLLQKRLLAEHRVAAATRNGHGAAEAHPGSTSSFSGQPSTPTSPTGSSSSNGSQEMENVSRTPPPRDSPVRFREVVEEGNEDHTVAVPTRFPTSSNTDTTTAARVADRWSVPVVENNSDLDNWRKRPPPRRDADDGGSVPAGDDTSKWF
ncbi:aquaporin-like protein [Leptomonas seymouri]|uniref:Aquaporin-like protein n=1 Tax=Leptomonas seymouri TaxID=5684 RepID=A0A0N1I348_LEPSE|nr:aquaporin-like protein [Leptomonas seymouri]|eukprot:KPI86205.1 aquaporin-like protein [Leptomonas seymouri]